MAITKTYNSSDQVTISDDSILEYSGGVWQLKDIAHSDMACAGFFSSTDDLSYSINDGTLTNSADAVIDSNTLDCTSDKYGQYVGTNNADNPNIFTVTMKVKPGYSGNPGSIQHFFARFKADDNSANGSLFYHSTNGQIYVMAKNSGGSTLFQAAKGVWNPSSGTWYHFVYQFDITNGATKLFIDNVQFGTTIGSTGTQDSNIGMFRIGRHWNTSIGGSDFHVKEFAVLNAVVAPSSVDTLAELYRYSVDNPTITVNDANAIHTNNFDSFTSTESASGSDAVKYVINMDGTDKYSTVGAIATSSGYAQSNTSAELTANIDDFDTDCPSESKIKAYFHSDDGSTTPTLTSATFTYTYGRDADNITKPTLIGVSGFLYDEDGPVASKKVYIRPYDPFFGEDVHFGHYSWQEVCTTSAEGQMIFECYESTTSSDYWELRYESASKRYKFICEANVSGEDAANWEDLTVEVINITED